MAAELWGDVDGVKVKSAKYGKGMILNGLTMQEAFGLDRVCTGLSVARGCSGPVRPPPGG
ncbi:MAG: hypothetical protein ACLR8Y_04405 [Alistipes indistinctus]